jgi:hypothetical protein
MLANPYIDVTEIADRLGQPPSRHDVADDLRRLGRSNLMGRVQKDGIDLVTTAFCPLTSIVLERSKPLPRD